MTGTAMPNAFPMAASSLAATASGVPLPETRRLPLAMYVRTSLKPAFSATLRNAAISTLRPPTLTARSRTTKVVVAAVIVPGPLSPEDGAVAQEHGQRERRLRLAATVHLAQLDELLHGERHVGC